MWGRSIEKADDPSGSQWSSSSLLRLWIPFPIVFAKHGRGFLPGWEISKTDEVNVFSEHPFWARRRKLYSCLAVAEQTKGMLRSLPWMVWAYTQPPQESSTPRSLFSDGKRKAFFFPKQIMLVYLCSFNLLIISLYLFQMCLSFWSKLLLCLWSQPLCPL